MSVVIGKRMLLIFDVLFYIGRPSHDETSRSSLSGSLSSKAKVLDLNTRKSFSVKKEFKFDVEPGGFSLFYITGL